MKTPIYDFLKSYEKSRSKRFHMPGHKGVGEELPYSLDVTEIDGADSLFSASGIIAESEKYAGEIFSANSFYSTEGSTLSIKAMLYLAALYAKEKGEKPLILATRNAHKSFLCASALIDFDVEWINPEKCESYLSVKATLPKILKKLSEMERLPTALYLTSPDYLGQRASVKEIADYCHENGILLLVDNAHGAYLKFLPVSEHPIDLGADMCSDSAHKTLPALTGASYLHVSKNAPQLFSLYAKEAMSLFASTSPSYLVLASLDILNKKLTAGFREKLSDFLSLLSLCKENLERAGYKIVSEEALKITLDAKAYGYFGYEIANYLKENNIYCEFYDKDYTVLMLSSENGKESLLDLEKILCALPKRKEKTEASPDFCIPEKKLSIREAMLSPFEKISPRASVGRILARPSVSCPPAVPIIMPGELIENSTKERFEYYGISECYVVK